MGGIPHGNRAFPENSLWEEQRTYIWNYDGIVSVGNPRKVQAVAGKGDNGFRRLVSLGTFCSTWYNGGAKSG